MDKLKTDYESFGSLELKDNCTTYYARKKGRNHVANGTVCQDYCIAKNIDDETQIVCVADGHGGETYVKSDIGSRLACEVFCKIVNDIKNLFQSKEHKGKGDWLDYLQTRQFKNLYITAWKKAVNEDYLSDKENSKETEAGIIRKYGTTFLFTVYTKDNICVGQLGDGAILLLNNRNQCQIFKRHNVKINSHTSSLASNRGEFAFVIDIYDRDSFSYVLMSTDGVYDKLDTGNSFLLYANSLLQQVSENELLDRPFYVEGTDVSQISKDDCTIALLNLKNKSYVYEHSEIIQNGYTEIKFVRCLKGVEIYEAKKNEISCEIHVIDSGFIELDLETRCFTYVKAKSKISLSNGKVAFVYIVSNSWKRLNELIEGGEHLEKHYCFNDDEFSIDDLCSQEKRYSNEFWLIVYEEMLQIKDEMKLIHTALKGYALESVFITENNEVAILSDVLYKTRGESIDNSLSFGWFFDYFNIIGKITCGKISVPLFGCTSQGQNIVILHAVSKKKPLCRVIFNKKKKILGLWNATNDVWNLETGKRKEIPAQGVLRLNKDQVFYLRNNEPEISKDVVLVDGYVRYEVNIFKESSK